MCTHQGQWNDDYTQFTIGLAPAREDAVLLMQGTYKHWFVINAVKNCVINFGSSSVSFQDLTLPGINDRVVTDYYNRSTLLPIYTDTYNLSSGWHITRDLETPGVKVMIVHVRDDPYGSRVVRALISEDSGSSWTQVGTDFSLITGAAAFPVGLNAYKNRFIFYYRTTTNYTRRYVYDPDVPGTVLDRLTLESEVSQSTGAITNVQPNDTYLHELYNQFNTTLE